MGLIRLLVVAAVVGVIAWLICVFIGGLLALTSAPIITYVGHFMVKWAVLIGVEAALWVLAAGWMPSLAIWRQNQ